MRGFMNNMQLINIVFFAVGIASCLFIIFSISLRTIKKELSEIKKSIIDEIKQEHIHAVR